MLFTDSDIISDVDLTAIDAQCATVAATQDIQIQITGAQGIIRKTAEECGHEIVSQFQNYSGYLASPSIGINHTAAVNNIFSSSISRPRFRLNQVVALTPDPSMRLIQQWLAYSALYKLYRAAFARYAKKEDRFERKMELYADERGTAWNRIEAAGIPIVLVPLPCPGAIREPGAGTFSASNVSAAGSGSGDPGSQYDVAITWTGAQYVSPSNPANNESGPSASVSIDVAAGQLITVSISGLSAPASTPPNVGTADGLYTQMQATGWNVYVGTPGGTLYLQNATPIAVATTSYTLASKPTLSGSVLGAGQFPDYNFAWQRVRMRA